MIFFTRTEDDTEKQTAFYDLFEASISNNVPRILHALGFGPEWTCELQSDGEYHLMFMSHVAEYAYVQFTTLNNVLVFAAMKNGEAAGSSAYPMVKHM